MNIVGEAAISIDRPASTVWDWVVDPAKLHLWVKDIDEPGSWIDEAEATKGSRYRIDYKYGRKTNEIIFEVVAASPGKSFVVDTVEGPYPILVRYSFEESSTQTSTVVTINMNARSDSRFTAMLFIATGWFAKWFMKRRLQGELRDMKSKIESK